MYAVLYVYMYMMLHIHVYEVSYININMPYVLDKFTTVIRSYHQ